MAYIPLPGNSLLFDWGAEDKDYKAPASGDPIVFYFRPDSGGNIYARGFFSGASSFGHQVKNSRYLSPIGIKAPDWVEKVSVYPITNRIFLSWEGLGGGYIPPNSSSLSFSFKTDVDELTVYPAGHDALEFGASNIYLAQRKVSPTGIAEPFVSLPHVRNTAASFAPAGINALSIGSAVIWNWRQYLPLAGIISQAFGTTYVQGGVKIIAPGGLSAFSSGAHLVINTKADQEAKPAGIAMPAGQVPAPQVSPRFLRPQGLYATLTGFPLVQFPPQPAGWQSSAFGYPVIEYKTKQVAPAGIDGYGEGYPTIRDAARKLLHHASDVTALFGDVRVRLVNAFVKPQGWDSAELVDWTIVYSTRRWVLPQGLDATEWTAADIRNKTPSFAPEGFDSLASGIPDVGGRVREVRVDGVPSPLDAMPSPILWQTPGLKPAGVDAPAFPVPTIWPGVRTVEAKGSDMLRMGDAAAIGFSWRPVPLEGFSASAYGNAARIENANREVEPKGVSFMAFGTAWAAEGVRTVAPKGIDYPAMNRHQIGGARWLHAAGWEATQWLTRIIPEQQEIYPKTFTGEFGWPAVENATRFIPVEGVRTYPENSMHFGVARVWNLRQIIEQFEDPASGLAPPVWPDWTLIENRNKVFGVDGFVATRYGAAQVENKARPVLPVGIDAPSLPEWQAAGTVTHRVRAMPLEGIEAPAVPEWLVVWNKAFPIKPAGMVATDFGATQVVNLRRFRNVQGFDAQVFGYPMVADAIREVTFDSRYGIQPPRIELPEVKLHTRYVDAIGIGEPQYGSWFGSPELTIHWTMITPRWTHRDWFGEPTVRNNTPELVTRGRAADQWGDTFVRLEWRPLEAKGTDTQLFGLTRIADRKQKIAVAGRDFLTVSAKLVVIRPGEDPVATQYIELRKFNRHDDGTVTEASEGFGIPDDSAFFRQQVPAPNLMKGYIFHHQSKEATLWGEPMVKANTIRVEPGIGEYLMGEPDVAYKNRKIEVPTIGQQVLDGDSYYNLGSWGRPALSPHTIYAVNNAPAQAIRNHQNTPYITYVNTGIKTGSPVLGNYAREVRPYGITERGSGWGPGSPQLVNRRQTIRPTGVNLLRMGWVTIPGPQYISDAEFEDVSPMGRPSVAFAPSLGPYYLKPMGMAGAMGNAEVQNQNRQLQMTGFDSLAMGTRRSGDNPYQWQGLRVGPLMPTIPSGFITDGYGEAWVSLRVRGLEAEGFDSFVCDYDYQNFAARMRVRRVERPVSQLHILPQGWVDTKVAAPSMNRMRHYIRPDGNSDQFRKGVPA